MPFVTLIDTGTQKEGGRHAFVALKITKKRRKREMYMYNREKHYIKLEE